jgi:hypothetical protein
LEDGSRNTEQSGQHDNKISCQGMFKSMVPKLCLWQNGSNLMMPQLGQNVLNPLQKDKHTEWVFNFIYL